MLSSISSSDRRFLGRLLIWILLFVPAANVMAGYALRHWPWPTTRVVMAKYGARTAIEDYVNNQRDCPVVILGSSVAGALPPPGHDRPGVCTIAMVGQGPYPGLEIMDRIKAAPRVLFLESNLGFRDSEPGQVAALTEPAQRTLHYWLPLTTAQGNWINALWKSQISMQTNLYRPNIPWAQWHQEQEVSKPHPAGYDKPMADWDRWFVDDHLKHTAALVAALESRGTKVIFYQSPMEPRIAQQPIFALWAEKERAAFADHEWVTDDLEKYYLVDGIHFTTGSGEDFFDLLMSHVPPGILPPDVAR